MPLSGLLLWRKRERRTSYNNAIRTTSHAATGRGLTRKVRVTMFLLASQMMLLAQVAHESFWHGWTLTGMAIGLVVAIVVIGIVIVVIRTAQVTVPPWVIQIGWLVALAVVAIIAIKIVASL